MRDFFESHKSIIITWLIIIGITFVSGYLAEQQPQEESLLPARPLESQDTNQEANAEEMGAEELGASPIPSEARNEVLPEGQAITPLLAEESSLESREQKEPHISVTFAIEGVWRSLSVPEGSSVYEAMVYASDQGIMSFSGKEYAGLGFFVEEINGMRNNAAGNGKYWVYSVNAKKASVGVSSFILNEGDAIFWTYENET